MIKHAQLYFLSKQLFGIKSTNCLCIALNSIYVTNAPPQGNNTNTEDNSEFVLFFYNDYFGVKVSR